MEKYEGNIFINPAEQTMIAVERSKGAKAKNNFLIHNLFCV